MLTALLWAAACHATLYDALQQVVVLHGQTLEGRLTIGKANERGRAVPLRLDPA